MINHDGTEASSAADVYKVVAFNQHFLTKETLHNIPEFPPQDFIDTTDKVNLTPELVHNELSPCKSPGPDKLHPKKLQLMTTISSFGYHI